MDFHWSKFVWKLIKKMIKLIIQHRDICHLSKMLIILSKLTKWILRDANLPIKRLTMCQEFKRKISFWVLIIFSREFMEWLLKLVEIEIWWVHFWKNLRHLKIILKIVKKNKYLIKKKFKKALQIANIQTVLKSNLRKKSYFKNLR
jgi:hypothetical protein